MKADILLVSHSKMITDGIKEMIEQMNASEEITIHSDGSLGSDPMKIIDTINEADSDREFLIFADLGSAVLSSELAFDMLEEDQQKHYHLVDAPLVEGAFAAAITAGVSDDLTQILAEAQNAGKKGWN